MDRRSEPLLASLQLSDPSGRGGETSREELGLLHRQDRAPCLATHADLDRAVAICHDDAGVVSAADVVEFRVRHAMYLPHCAASFSLGQPTTVRARGSSCRPAAVMATRFLHAPHSTTKAPHRGAG